MKIKNTEAPMSIILAYLHHQPSSYQVAILLKSYLKQVKIKIRIPDTYYNFFSTSWTKKVLNVCNVGAIYTLQTSLLKKLWIFSHWIVFNKKLDWEVWIFSCLLEWSLMQCILVCYLQLRTHWSKTS